MKWRWNTKSQSLFQGRKRFSFRCALWHKHFKQMNMNEMFKFDRGCSKIITFYFDISNNSGCNIIRHIKFDIFYFSIINSHRRQICLNSVNKKLISEIRRISSNWKFICLWAWEQSQKVDWFFPQLCVRSEFKYWRKVLKMEFMNSFFPSVKLHWIHLNRENKIRK